MDCHTIRIFTTNQQPGVEDVTAGQKVCHEHMARENSVPCFRMNLELVSKSAFRSKDNADTRTIGFSSLGPNF